MSRLKLLMVRVQPVIAVEDDEGRCERVIEEEPRVIAATEWPEYSERLERELAAVSYTHLTLPTILRV